MDTVDVKGISKRANKYGQIMSFLAEWRFRLLLWLLAFSFNLANEHVQVNIYKVPGRKRSMLPSLKLAWLPGRCVCCSFHGRWQPHLEDWPFCYPGLLPKQFFVSTPKKRMRKKHEMSISKLNHMFRRFITKMIHEVYKCYRYDAHLSYIYKYYIIYIMTFTNSGFPCLKICPPKKSRQLHLVAGTSSASCLKAMGLEASLMSGKAGGQRCWMCLKTWRLDNTGNRR